MNSESEIPARKQLSQSRGSQEYQIFLLNEDGKNKDDLRRSRWDSFYRTEAKPGEPREHKYPVFDRSSIEIIDSIGRSGKYLAAYDKVKKRNLLLKRIKIRDFSVEKDKRIFHNEKKILKIVNSLANSPFSKLENVFRKRYETHIEYTIVFSRGDCTLEEILAERKKLKKRYSEKEVVTILRDILNCLLTLKNESIAYMGLRADNVIYFNDLFSYSLIDFENCVMTELPARLSSSRANETFELYSSPERTSYKNQSYDPYKSDIWSLGVLLLETIGENVESLRTNQLLIKSKITNMINPNRRKLYPFVAGLLDKMLSEDPEERPSLSKIIEQVLEYLATLEKFNQTFDDEFAALVRKRRLEAFVKRNSLSDDLQLYVETLRIARNEAKKKKDFKVCLTLSEDIYKKIKQDSDHDKDVIFAIEILNWMKYKKLTETISREDYDLMYQEKTKIFRLLNKNYEKLAPKLIYMMEIFIYHKVYTVPIEICEMVIDQSPRNSLICTNIESKYRDKMVDMKQALEDDIIRKSKKTVRKSSLTILLIICILALVAYLMDMSTSPREICDDKGECYVYREKWLKLEVGSEGDWTVPRVWMNNFFMCGVTLYYSPNNVNNLKGPSYVSSMKFHTCKKKKWSTQYEYYLMKKQKNTVYNQTAHCESNRFVQGFKIKTSIDADLRITFLSGFSILCGEKWITIERSSPGFWDGEFSLSNKDYVCGARIKSVYKYVKDFAGEESKVLFIDGIQIRVCPY